VVAGETPSGRGKPCQICSIEDLITYADLICDECDDGGGGGGLDEVSHDQTLAGQGTVASPLRVLSAPAGIIQYPAAGVVSSHRAVILDANGRVAHADSTDVGHRDLVAGISLNAAVALGDPVSVVEYGDIIDAGFAFTEGECVFFTDTGVLTQTAPAVGFSKSVGFAYKPDTIRVRIGPSITLAP